MKYLLSFFLAGALLLFGLSGFSQQIIFVDDYNENNHQRQLQSGFDTLMCVIQELNENTQWSYHKGYMVRKWQEFPYNCHPNIAEALYAECIDSSFSAHKFLDEWYNEIPEERIFHYKSMDWSYTLSKEYMKGKLFEKVQNEIHLEYCNIIDVAYKTARTIDEKSHEESLLYAFEVCKKMLLKQKK